MADRGDITLDPGVLEGSQGETVPITDLYGLPVFDPDIEKQIDAAEQEEQWEISTIRSQIFHAHADETAENIRQIRNQVFQTEASLVKTTGAKEEDADGSGNTVLVLQFMAVIFLVILLFYQRYRQKRRREVIDDINDYGK